MLSWISLYICFDCMPPGISRGLCRFYRRRRRAYLPPRLSFCRDPTPYGYRDQQTVLFLGTVISAARLYRYMDLRLAGACVACSLAGSGAGSFLALLSSEDLIRYMLLPVLPVVAYYVLRQKKLDASGKPPLSRRNTFLVCLPVSLLVGAYDGFYGPGTGTFLILLYTSLARLDLLTASANTKAVNLASNIGALTVFILNGKVFFPVGLPAALFCIAGHYLGAGMVVKNGTKIVKPMILLVLAILFVKLLAGE